MSLLDVIRAELQRQARAEKLDLESAERPDDVRVYGILDLYELAKVIEHAHQGRSGG